MDLLIGICSGLVALLLSYFLGKKRSDLKHERIRNEELEHEAQMWADMPLDDDNLIVELRKRANKKD